MTMRFDVPVTSDGRRRMSPTDVSHFIRQGNCQRFLRLMLLERRPGPSVLHEYGVRDQGLTPLLTSTGLAFEQQVELAIGGQIPSRKLGQGENAARREADNRELVNAARRLPADSRTVLFQTRLRAALGSWDLRGDADLILLQRDRAGRLSVLVADIKSSTRPRLEHQLQVAFYAAMISAVLEIDEVAVDRLDLGVLYRPTEADRLALDPELAKQIAQDRLVARQTFGTGIAGLALVADREALNDTIADLVSKPGSLAEEVAELPFAEVPYHLADICDGCRFNEFCMKWTAEYDDLSLIPFMTGVEKSQLIRAGVRTTADLARLKRLEERPPGGTGPRVRLVTQPDAEPTVRALAGRSPVGPRLDELIVRAHAYRRDQGDDQASLPFIPGGGPGSLPLVSADAHANLVWVYIDAQTDYLNERLYLLAARVVACERGEAVREESVIEMTDGPPDDGLAERDIVNRWAARLVAAVGRLAAPDPETGARRAPIHLVFFSGKEVGDLLDGLSRHLQEVFGATALYDMVAQPAAYDSPLITRLADEIRARRNLPLIAQSLYRAASFQGFDWNEPRPFRKLFHARTFDYFGRLPGDGDEPGAWFMRHARFRSGIPLEYAYGVWGRLESRPDGGRDTVAPYLVPTRDDFVAFVERRLDALRHLASELTPNRDAGKTSFDLPDLGSFEARAHGLGEALLEFLQIERHVEMAQWRRVRQIEPERRMAMGQGWVASFHDGDQEPDVRAALANARERYDAREVRARTGDKLTAEENRQFQWSLVDRPLRFRVALDGDGADVAELLATSDLHDADRAILYERMTSDRRLPEAERHLHTPTPKQLLYGPRVAIRSLEASGSPDGPGAATITLELLGNLGGNSKNGYTFAGHPRPPRDGETYTLDPNPDDYYGSALQQTVAQIVEGRQNTLFERLIADRPVAATWPDAAAAGQARFMAGLDALRDAGHLHGFEPSKHAFIGAASAEPFLLVQGPPGTGKSYTTAFALYARLQGAMAAGIDFRIAAGCKTHAATDVLMRNVEGVRGLLTGWRQRYPAVFEHYFDARLIDVPILRADPRERPAEGIDPLWGRPDKDDERILPDDRVGLKGLGRDRYALVFATPFSIRKLDEPQARNKTQRRPIHCLVLDEASQMNLPEAIMAARLLDPAGQVIVVGDHRQMAPIVKHDWDGERRRTFQEYAAYRSLFDTLRMREPAPATIRFAESFRLHTDMARFLRDQIYVHDGIDYHSRRDRLLPGSGTTDAFVAAVLDPDHPLVVVTHDERDSQTRNLFEVALMSPVLRVLSADLDLDPSTGLGVVVPHRAQRAAFQRAVPELIVTLKDGRNLSAVDTVEKFQGGERRAMVFAATESDTGYLATRADFLYDPRRLTVALSRAKEKMILVASGTVFAHFSPDEETFANVLLWKNLLRRTCTVRLWQGSIEGHSVTVWGNSPAATGDGSGTVSPAGIAAS